MSVSAGTDGPFSSEEGVTCVCVSFYGSVSFVAGKQPWPESLNVGQALYRHPHWENCRWFGPPAAL